MSTLNKICFITSLVVSNDYEPDVPGNFEKMNNCDYKLFTNDKSELKEFGSWDVIEVNFREITDSNNPVILSRVVKFQPWKIKELNRYDILIYCDAYWTPKKNEFIWNNIFTDLYKSNSGIIQSKNPYRNCAYDECVELINTKKHSIISGENTIDLLKQNKLPKNFGLWRNTFLVYLSKNECIKILFNKFWELYKDNRYTHRDQPLYSLASYLTNIIPDEVKTKRMDHNFFEMNGKRGGIDGKHIYVF